MGVLVICEGTMQTRNVSEQNTATEENMWTIRRGNPKKITQSEAL
jgi:hypothetical protein